MKYLFTLVVLICMVVPAIAQDQSQEAIKEWTESPTCKWISTDNQRSFVFNLGVVYNLGIRDGYDRILRQKNDRVNIFPVFKLYAGDKRLEDLHRAYEAGSHQGYLNRH